MNSITFLTGWGLVIFGILALYNFIAIWHVWMHNFATATERIVWFLVCILIPVFGPTTYLVFGLRRTIKKTILETI